MIYNNIMKISKHFNLPFDINYHILFFVKISSVNYIISFWKRYISYKGYIIHNIQKLPKFNSFFNNDLRFSVVSKSTYFFFNKLFNITTGNESYFYYIHHYFYCLALSIDDYEWVSRFYNKFYYMNKSLCISIATKFKWNHILHLLDVNINSPADSDSDA